MLIIYVIYFASSVFAQRFFLPKPAPKPYKPPKPYIPLVPPKLPNPTNVRPPATVQQIVIQTNLAELEEKAGSGKVGTKFAEQLVNALQGSVTGGQETSTYSRPTTGM